jgi:hypothetical protein
MNLGLRIDSEFFFADVIAMEGLVLWWCLGCLFLTRWVNEASVSWCIVFTVGKTPCDWECGRLSGNYGNQR